MAVVVDCRLAVARQGQLVVEVRMRALPFVVVGKLEQRPESQSLLSMLIYRRLELHTRLVRQIKLVRKMHHFYQIFH